LGLLSGRNLSTLSQIDRYVDNINSRPAPTLLFTSLLQLPSPIMHQSLLPPFSTAAYISVGTLILAVLLLSKLSSKPPSRSKKERIAKESFRVRKSNLLAVSGRGPDKRRFKYKQQWRFNDKRCVDDDDAVENDSWFFRIIRLFHQYFIDAFARLFRRDYMKPTSHNNESTTKPFTPKLPPKISLEDYYNNVQVVGLDCEMVGGGKGGMNSMLARCSVVTLDCIPIHQADDKILLGDTKKINSINQNLVVLYDKYVIPKGRITDYRTQWSGITKETYHSSSTHDVPVVTFYQCQKEITELFSSIDGRSVVVVGHALENDFDALEIKVRSTVVVHLLLFCVKSCVVTHPYCLWIASRRIYSRHITLSSIHETSSKTFVSEKVVRFDQ
jgi:hypothetical protein